MKEGWEIRKLGEVCSLITKGTTPTSIGFDFTDSGVNFVKVESFTEDGCIVENKVTHISNGCNDALKRSQLQENDILFSIAGALGRVAIVNKNVLPANTNQALAIIRLFDKNTNFLRYIYHYFHSELIINQINKFKGGVAQQNLSLKQLSDLEILIPPLSEQQRIVSKLDSAFEKIDALKANAENNLKNAKDLFQQVLKKELEPKEGWKYELLRDVSTVFSRGKSKHRPRNDAKLFGGAYPFIQTGEIRNSNKYVIDYTTSYNDVGLSQSKLWPSETLCITIAANIAETAILKFPCCFPDSVIGLVVDKRKADVNFMYYMLQSFKAQLQELGKGSAQDNINLSTFENKRFPIPSLSEQQRIVSILDSLSEKCKRLEENYSKTAAECDALKQSILREVMSGE